MKPVYLLVILFVMRCIHVHSQVVSSISLGGEYAENFSIRNYAGTLQVEIPIEKKWAVNYKFGIGGSTNRVFYTHAPVGAAFGTILLKAIGGSGSSGVNALGAFLFIIPEGVTFYPNPDHRIQTGIFLAPLGCDYWYKNSSYEYFRFSGELGGKVKIPLGNRNRFALQLQGGIRYLYRHKIIDPFFIHTGVGISINLD